jgi:hypothetical protein
MTTFTLQDLNLPTTAEQAVETITKEKWMEYGMNNPISTSAIDYAQMGKDLANHELAHQQAQQARLDAVPPQPTCGQPVHTPSQVSPEAVIDEMLYTIKQSLLLLATVIKQQANTTPPEGNPPSLQETIELTLQQADWFQEMVKNEVENRVESEVESYFQHGFDPTDHFDFGDAISSEVHDRIDDAVRDHIDDAVADKVEEVVAEKLESASVSISF